MAEEADVVLVMEAAHRDVVLRESPRALSRTFLIGELAPLLAGMSAGESMRGPTDLVADLHSRRGRQTPVESDVVDPIGRPLEVHQGVGDSIAGALVPMLEAVEPLLRSVRPAR